MITSSAVNSLHFITSFFVALWVGLSAVATLSVALTVSALLSLFIYPTMLAYRAYITKAFETGNLERGNVMSTKLIELFALFAAPMLLFIVRFSTFFIELVSTREYLDSSLLLPFALVSVLLVFFADFWRFRLDLAKKTYLTAGVYLTGTTALVASCLILIPPLGLIGVGIALVVYGTVILLLVVLSGNSFFPIQLRSHFMGVWCLSAVLMVVTDIALQFVGVPALISLALSGVIYSIAVFSTRILKIRDVRSVIRFLVGH